jgi:hypothetical protein
VSQQSYFVADDRVHAATTGRFVSACGWRYPPALVEWSGDYEPEAWVRCPDCPTDRFGDEPDAEPRARLVDVVGAYATDDLAHVRVDGSDPHAFLAACGASHEPPAVEWSGDDWPWTWNRCQACVALLDVDGTAPDEPEPPMHSADDLARGAVAERRAWVEAGADGRAHRPRDFPTRVAMCGADLRPGATLVFRGPRDGVRQCDACNTAVGAERRAERGLAPLPVPPPKKNPAERPAPARLARPPRPRAATRARPATPARRTGGRPLAGRKMVLPRVRFVSGGAPGLGKRR